MEQAKDRPPYVKFEVRAVEDRTATMEAGHYVAKDIIFAVVTPAGSKDRLEKNAEEWVQGQFEAAQNDRIPREWADAFKRALDNYKAGQEEPVAGTSVKNWNAISPSQLRLLEELNIRTIEDVAVMNEEAVGYLGMGARALKEKAQAWLDASDRGASAAELEQVRVENAALMERNKSLEARLERLEKLVPVHDISEDDTNDAEEETS